MVFKKSVETVKSVKSKKDGKSIDSTAIAKIKSTPVVEKYDIFSASGHRHAYSLKDVNFYIKKDVSLKGYTLIEGFPGMGLVGTISAKYLVEKLNFEQIGFVDAPEFVPFIRIHQGIPVHPSRIFILKEKKLAVIISEQIIPQNFTHVLATAVSSWILEEGIAKVISLSGIKAEHSQRIGNKVLIYGFASDINSISELEAEGVEVIKEGITTGITALIMLELKDNQIPAYALLGNVSIAADYKASAEIVRKVAEILKLDINVQPLFKEAKETEAELLKQIQDIKKVSTEENKSYQRTPMYT